MAGNVDCALPHRRYDARRMAMADDEYFLLVGEETRGPFALGQLHEQWHAGHLPLDALVIRKGNPETQPVNAILERIISYRPPTVAVEMLVAAPPAGTSDAEARGNAAPPNYSLRLGLGLVAFAVLAFILNPGRPKPSAQHVLHGRVEVTRVELRVENLNLFDWTNVVVRLEVNDPAAMHADLASVAAGATVKVPLINFKDGAGKSFEPWKSVVSEVWLGGAAYEFRKFPFELK